MRENRTYGLMRGEGILAFLYSTRKENERLVAGTSENNAITASVADMSIHEAVTASNIKKNAATHTFENI